MKIIFAVFYFNLTNLLRNFKSAGIMFILPIVFMGVFALAFGGSSSIVNFKIGIFQQDESKRVVPDVAQIFKQVSESSEQVQISSLIYSDISQLRSSVESGEVNLGIAISLNKSDNTQSINLILKESSQDSQLYAGIVKDIIYSSTLPNESLAQTEVINENTNATSVFDFIAPGLIIYGLLILIPGIAESFSKITEKRYIFRFANSRAKSWHIILGTVLYYLLIATIQFGILYIVATMFGYRASGNVFFAIPVALLTGLFVIGVGLLIGGFVKKTEAATNLGTIISIIFGFFSGSFIAGIGNVLKFDLFGNTIMLTDLLPSKWGTDAVEKILSNNLGLGDITKELLILGISSLIIILIGIYVYQKRQLRAE